MAYLKQIGCECGEWSGQRCEWRGPEREAEIIEFFPQHVRASHKAAGNSGCYPHNGARRIRVSPACAEAIVSSDGEWASAVQP